QAEDGIRYRNVTGVQTCALPISKDLQPVCLRQVLPPMDLKMVLRRSPVSHPGTLSLDVGFTNSYGTDGKFCQPPANKLGRWGVRSEERRVGKECRCRWWRVE